MSPGLIRYRMEKWSYGLSQGWFREKGSLNYCTPLLIFSRRLTKWLHKLHSIPGIQTVLGQYLTKSQLQALSQVLITHWSLFLQAKIILMPLLTPVVSAPVSVLIVTKLQSCKIREKVYHFIWPKRHMVLGSTQPNIEHIKIEEKSAPPEGDLCGNGIVLYQLLWLYQSTHVKMAQNYKYILCHCQFPGFDTLVK